MHKRIYLDYAASTPLDPRVLRAMRPYFSEKFGNPGSLHSFGQEAIAAVGRSRDMVARLLGASVEDGFRGVVFTGSATEANNLALRGVVKMWRKKYPGKIPRIIVSQIEHESVLDTAGDLEREGAEVVHLAVGSTGVVDFKKLRAALAPETALVSIMLGNNVIGAIEPIGEIGKIITDWRVKHGSIYPLLHTDATQAAQFLDLSVSASGADMVTLSAQKMCGPKGVGALYIRKHTRNDILPIITGGGQEFGLRSGTENVAGIVGFAKAYELASAMRRKEVGRLHELKLHLYKGFKRIIPNVRLNGALLSGKSLPHILSLYVPGKKAEDLLLAADEAGLAISTGSACKARAIEPSYVIRALGHDVSRARASMRISLGRQSTKGEIDTALKIFKNIITKI